MNSDSTSASPGATSLTGLFSPSSSSSKKDKHNVTTAQQTQNKNSNNMTKVKDDDNTDKERKNNNFSVTNKNNNNNIKNNKIPAGATSLMGLFSPKNNVFTPNSTNQNDTNTSNNKNSNNKNHKKQKKTINWSESVRSNNNDDNVIEYSWDTFLCSPSSRDNNDNFITNETSSLLSNINTDNNAIDITRQNSSNNSDYNSTNTPLYNIFNNNRNDYYLSTKKTSSVVLDDIERDIDVLDRQEIGSLEYPLNNWNNKTESSTMNNAIIINNDKNDNNYRYDKNIIKKQPWMKTTAYYKEKIKKNYCSISFIRTTIIGSLTFSLYHCVFCLAVASTISRPSKYNADDSQSMYSVLGPMTKMGALGPILIAPLLIPILGVDNPALYPSIDLFLTPFISHMAQNIDASLNEQKIHDKNDVIFLATFSALNGLGLLLSAMLCILASRVKLANFGAFLPYPVLCGFFSTVGLLLWTLAINVDTNGLTVSEVLMSGNLSIIWDRFLVHHLPSFIIGTAMFILRQRNSIYLVILILLSIFGTYFVMFITGTSLKTAQENQWFWTADSFTIDEQHGLSPPAVFGIIGAIFQSNINFQAFLAGTKTALAMAFIYALRCSILAPALRKNTRVLRGLSVDNDNTGKNLNTVNSKKRCSINDASADSYYVELATNSPTLNNHRASSSSSTSSSSIKKMGSDLHVLLWFGCGQILSAFSGSFACVPSTGAAITMYKLGAGGTAPQYGSCFILLCFYISDFQIVSYIPKMVFSSLLVNTFVDLIVIYFYRSFHKTKQKWEWVVGVPLIMIFSNLFGILQSIAIGVGLSTIIFVASFYRTGVVKFVGNGLTVRSTIERIGNQALWLDRHGDLIQILVLQNYLFFGNASSCKHYIESMFEEPEVPPDFPLPPIPKFIVLDFAIVTGIDTSTVDVFNDIIEMCNSNGCAVYLSGLSPTIKSVLAFGGVKPGFNTDSIMSNGIRPSTKKLAFFPNMESALGKAEDRLIKEVYMIKEKDEEQLVYRTRKRLMSQDDDGFFYALQQVDEQHGISFADSLGHLKQFTRPIELSPGDNLFGLDDEVREPERGLFFIEFGTLKVERDPTYTISRSINNISLRKVDVLSHKVEGGSISNLNARAPSVGKELAMLKGVATKGQTQRATHSFRLATFGPGWVVGMTRLASGMRNPGLHIAATKCRLHNLPYQTIQKIEKKNPSLILELFKMLSHLNARRQDLTIEQLSILHAINSSRAPTKPLSRSHMAAVNKAMSAQGFASS